MTDSQTHKKTLSIDEASTRVSELSEIIRYHNQRYYEQDNPEIPDVEYDKLFRELQNLEEQFPELQLSTSPTLRVGGDALDGFKKLIMQFECCLCRMFLQERSLKLFMNV